jgi:hypothetical protein
MQPAPPAAALSRMRSGALENEQAVDLLNPFIVAVVNEFGSIGAAMADSTRAGVGVLNPTKTTSIQDPFFRRQSVLDQPA